MSRGTSAQLSGCSTSPVDPLRWLTPRKQFHGDSLKRLVAQPRVLHLSWRGLSVGSLSGRRVLYAWPNRKHLNQLRDVDAEALAVIEWNEIKTAEWIEDARPIQLFRGKTVQPTPPLR